MVVRVEFKLSLKNNIPFVKFHFQTFLVAVFVQSRSEFFVNFVDCTNYIIYVVFQFWNINIHVGYILFFLSFLSFNLKHICCIYSVVQVLRPSVVKS